MNLTSKQGPEIDVASVATVANVEELRTRPAMTIMEPLFILAPPRSFASLVGSMLGEHPQMYGLPETHLFGFETMTGWLDGCSRATFNMAEGLVRAVANLYFGVQTEASIKQAGGWLRRRAHYTTGYLLEVMAERVHPLILVYKSPSIVYRVEFMDRARSMFPRARFIHLLEHPRAHGEAVIRAIREAAARGRVPSWLLHLASFADPVELDEESQLRPDLDPQKGWYVLHRNIVQFLDSVPDDQKMWIRGEDVVGEPEIRLAQIASWIGLRTDQEAIDAMKHPERSPYACFGPPGARYGNDPAFWQNSVLGPARTESQTLEGPLSWREDSEEFMPEVKQLARRFGYE